MKPLMSKQISTYKRKLEDKKMYTSIYVFILLITVIIYGLLGIVPLIKVIKLKQDTANELNMINESLQIKKDKLAELNGNMPVFQYYLKTIQRSIPQEPQVQQFIVDLASVAARSGFKQRSVFVVSNEEDKTSLTVRFEGNPKKTQELIEAIESMPRLTEVKNFRYDLRETVGTIRAEIVIFYTPI